MVAVTCCQNVAWLASSIRLSSPPYSHQAVTPAWAAMPSCGLGLMRLPCGEAVVTRTRVSPEGEQTQLRKVRKVSFDCPGADSEVLLDVSPPHLHALGEPRQHPLLPVIQGGAGGRPSRR